MRLRLLSLAIILFTAALSFGQSTAVTLQVTDSGGQSWNNGSWTASLVSGPGLFLGPDYFIVGSHTVVPNQLQSGVLDGTGSASLTLTPNASIAPTGTVWYFAVCPNATIDCYRQTVTIAGASQTVTLAPPAIAITAANMPPNSRAYSDSEIIGPTLGTQYYNVSSLFQRIYNGTAWLNLGGNGGGVNNNQGTVGAAGYYATTGTVISPDKCTFDGNGNETCNSITTNGIGTGAIAYLAGSKLANPPSGKCQFWVNSTTGTPLWNNSSGNSCGAIQDAANFTGATFDVVLNACLSAASGGICDARQITGSQTIAAQVNIPTNTWLQLGAVTATCTISDGVSSCFSLAGHSHLIGSGQTITNIVASASANVSSMVTNSNHLGGAGDIDIRHMHFQGNASATIPQVMDLQAIFPPSNIAFNLVDCFPSIGIHGRDNNGWGFGPITFIDNYINGTSGCVTPNNRPFVLEAVANGGFMNAAVFGGLIEHGGTNQAIVEVNGNGIGIADAPTFTSFVYCVPYIENMVGETGQTGIKIRDVGTVKVCPLGTGGSSSWVDVVNISQSATGLTNNVTLEGISFQPNGVTGNSYNNTITSETSTAHSVQYGYSNNKTITSNTTLTLNAAGSNNILFSSGTAGQGLFVAGADGSLANAKTGSDLIAIQAPSISSGFGTSPSIVNQNGSAAFLINVGTGGTATTGVILMGATAHTGWNCFATDRNTNIVTRETAATTTTVTLTAASAWTASDILQVSCFGY